MVELVLVLILLALGFFVGRYLEQRHYASILAREQRLNYLLTFAKRYPDSLTRRGECQLVYGSAVISIDYFKQFVAGLRTLVGGRVKTYESLVDRARREAILRMKEEARKMDASAIINVKVDTASIYKGYQQRVGSIEVYAYGTALR